MIFILEVWQAVIAVILLVLLFGYCGYITSKVFFLSQRDINQRKYINSLRIYIQYLENPNTEEGKHTKWKKRRQINIQFTFRLTYGRD